MRVEGSFVRGARLAVGAAVAAVAAGALFGGVAACDPVEHTPAHAPKAPPCPPPPEPTYQATVVGTIGTLHLVESRYPISRLGDVLAAFKPDLLLLAVRVDPFREGHLEDASFEMTYVNALAKQHGVEVEPIDWFREQDLAAPAPPAEPWDEAEIARREGSVLHEPRLYTFDRANGSELFQKILLATDADARHRSGDPLVARRHAWMQHLAASAVERHDRPKRVLAVVDVLDRPAIDLLLHGEGYTTLDPLAVVTKSKDQLISDIPGDVLNEWRAELERARANATQKPSAPEKAFWAEREHALQIVVDKRAQCCVTQSTVNAP